MKKCKTCGEEKEFIDFGRKGYNKDGSIRYEGSCKICRNKKQRERQNKEYNKKRYQENKEYHKEYNKKNKEYRKSYHKEYFQKNYGDYYIENKEILLVKNREFCRKRKEEYDSIIKTIFHTDNIHKITYIIKSKGFYKIGSTTNLWGRLRCLSNKILIEKVYLLDKNIEKRLLKELLEYKFDTRVEFSGHTECVNCSDEIINFILKREHFKEFVDNIEN